MAAEKKPEMQNAVVQQDSDPCAPGSPAQTTDSPSQNILISNQHLQNINPLLCGQQACAPGYAYGPKIRFYYLIHYVVSGKGAFVCGEETYPVSRGQLFIVRPGEATFYQADENDPWHYRWVGFQSDLDLSQVLADPVVSAPECEHIFRSLMQCEKMENMREYYICAKIFELISLLAQHREMKHNVGREYALQAKNFVDTNFFDNRLSISYLAGLLNLDRSYFSALFKKHIGKSPQQYLVDFRLQKATEMLATGKQPLAQVASDCGYTDLFHFSKMFKRKYGVAPSQYYKTDSLRVKRQAETTP